MGTRIFTFEIYWPLVTKCVHSNMWFYPFLVTSIALKLLVPTTESTQVENINSSHNTHQICCSMIPELTREDVVKWICLLMTSNTRSLLSPGYLFSFFDKTTCNLSIEQQILNGTGSSAHKRTLNILILDCSPNALFYQGFL